MEQDTQIVLPGEVISETTDGLMSGNGVTVQDGKIIATICGFITKNNSLISVTPLSAIYSPNTGDVVIGRIEQVQKQKWKVQIGCPVLADLRLSSIYLPDGELRRRTTTDERNMRQYFDVGDIICAEVQSARDAVFLHTREQHPKKLDKGIVVEVPSRLVKRVPNHIVVLTFAGLKFQCVFSLNGSIWLAPEGEEGYSVVPRIRNCIVLLGTYEQMIYPESVSDLFNKTSEIPVAEILSQETAKTLGFIENIRS